MSENAPPISQPDRDGQLSAEQADATIRSKPYVVLLVAVTVIGVTLGSRYVVGLR